VHQLCGFKSNWENNISTIKPLSATHLILTMLGWILRRIINIRRVWRYQRGNQNPYIEEEQTTKWPKEKVQKDKQRSTKHTHTTKDRVTRTSLKTGSELRCTGRVSSSWSNSATRRVNLVTNRWWMRKWPFTTSGTYPYRIQW
jgi:hypothetical protein